MIIIKPQPKSPSMRGVDANVCSMATWRYSTRLVKRHGRGWDAEFA